MKYLELKAYQLHNFETPQQQKTAPILSKMFLQHTKAARVCYTF